MKRLAVLAVVFAAASAARAYDAAADFSIASNPNGVWSYGWSSTLTGALTLDTSARTSGVLVDWAGNLAGDGNPVVSKNTSNSTVSTSTVTWLPLQMIQHPGPGGEYSIVRFRAPTAGVFNLAYGFIGQDGTSTDVHVLVNGASIFDSAINGYGNQAGGSSARTLAAGATVDLCVGYGGNGFFNDSTGSSLTITPVPEPASFAALGIGTLALLRRRSRGWGSLSAGR